VIRLLTSDAEVITGQTAETAIRARYGRRVDTRHRPSRMTRHGHIPERWEVYAPSGAYLGDCFRHDSTEV